MQLVAPPGLPRLIVRPGEVQLVVGLARRTVLRLEQRGLFPKRLRLGARATGWRLVDLEDWLRSRPEASQRPESRHKSGVEDDIGL